MTLNGPGRFDSHLTLVFVLAALFSTCGSGPLEARSSGQTSPQHLFSADFLLGNEPMQRPLATTAFKPPEGALLPAAVFNGILSLNTKGALNRIETVVDTFGIAAKKRWKLTTLPSFSFQYVADGTTIIPVRRQPQRSKHPYWEIILEPGRVWRDSSDMGWSRASLPFSLKERNQNCTHNGLMTFLYKGDGSTSRLAWQITSETCLYLKVNLWGIVEADYTPGPVPASNEVIAAYRTEVASRLPLKPFSALEIDHPELDPVAFQPAGIDDASVYGFVLDGVHYRSECPTRYGPYPYCEVLDLPSYSLSKSLFAGLAYIFLNRRWPEFASTSISELIPECALRDGRWDGVTPAHLINMTTGNYNSSVFNADEDNSMTTFFLAETHKDKLRFSCKAWPHKSPAGTQWVYHTSDTYLLGVAMNTFLQQKLGAKADIHRDLLYPQLFRPLSLSPVMQWTQRTYDKASQAFAAYGLIFHSDDLARIAVVLNSDNEIINTMAGNDFDTAMFRAGNRWPTPPGTQGLAYSNGFWAVDASKWISCSTETWLPFMSGYGGIAVVLLPNGGVYYFFTDSNQHVFRNAAVETNKALNYCKE